jgi:acyl dehydratase
MSEKSIPIVGLGKHWDELSAGDVFQTVGRTITGADLTMFVGATGMVEVLFTNTHYLDTETDFRGKRLVPAALIYSFAEGLLVQSVLQRTGVAFLGMELTVEGPTFAGDTIHVECEVLESRPTRKPGRGLVRTRNRVVNQDGATVLTYTPVRLVKGAP